MGRADKEFVKEIASQSADFSQWYLDVIKKADLMDYAPVRGCMVIKPDGYEIWEHIQAALDRRFKATGHRNAYFPMFIPESMLQKEAEHVEGFNPELPWVTEAAGEKLSERLAIRPTSETIICEMYSRWIQSYRDLPMLLNQWCSVVRWEKRTLPFLRTTEFLWQEGHTAHATEAEARAEVLQMLEVYREFCATELAIPVIAGQKTPSEKFAGAVETHSIEAMMRDGRALQAGTSHYMGQNFARAFDITFLDKDGELKHVYTTSWGVTTRLIGAVVMVHGDDRGLVLPPRVAPVQAVIVPIAPSRVKDQVLSQVRELAAGLQAALPAVRLKLDDREEYTPGWKFNEYEMRGVPIRVDIGPRDLEAGQAVLVRRDSGEKQSVPLPGLAQAIADLLLTIQKDLLSRALQFRHDHSHVVDNVADLAQRITAERGFFLAGWCGSVACERQVKEQTGATARNIPAEPPEQRPHCLVCGAKAAHTVWFARSY